MTRKMSLSDARLRRLGLAILTDSIEVIAFIKDCQGRYVWMNPYGLHFFETTLDALVGKTVQDFIGTAQAQAMTATEQQVLASGTANEQIEHLVLRVSDERRSFRTVRLPMQYHTEVVGLCGYSQELTRVQDNAATLLDSKSLLDTILNQLPALISIKDQHGAYLYANDMTLQHLGATLSEVVGKTDFDLLEVPTAQRFRTMEEAVLACGQRLEQEELVLTSSGECKHYLSFKLPLHFAQDNCAVLGFSTDITHIKKTQQALTQSEARFRALFESSSEAVLLMTPERFIDCNSAALLLFGLRDKEAFLGLQPIELAPETQPDGIRSQERIAQIIATTIANDNYRTEITIQRWDNAELVPLEIMATSLDLDHERLLMVTLRDFSEHHKQMALIEKMALYDSLTDLPNRKLLQDRIKLAMAAVQRQRKHAALMFLDLDNFKPLNDCYGHQAGDLLLREVGVRLKHELRAEDTVARQGGDEFIVLLMDLDESHLKAELHALQVAEKLRHALQLPYILELQPGKVVEHHCSSSIGVAVFGPGETNIDDVLRRADHAMYRAKAKGRNCVRLSIA